jgi:Methyltransferase domain
MNDTPSDLVRCAARDGRNRLQLWASFLNRIDARTVAEIGVYGGAFAAHMLESCPQLETYYMVDPWRHLDDWNKPANRDDDTFRRLYESAMRRTRSHEHQRVVLRGRTTEVAGEIPDRSLDFAYVDGDHTLRGITIDLVRVYPKVRDGGWLGGDDFWSSIWRHGDRYEPTLVFPFAVHFAEAVGARIYGLPRSQFLLEKRAGDEFEFIDLTGRYGRVDLLGQMAPRREAAARLPRRILRGLRDRLSR